MADFPEVDLSWLPSSPPLTIFLVFDVNGLLCDSDSGASGKIRWRENLNGFLRYCFAQFEVVFWSACGGKKLERYKKELQELTKVILRSDRLFGQDLCECSQHRDPLNPEKPIFLKPLSKFFAQCPDANASNTVLIDDSPDKSCMNDPRNAIHPFTYRSSDPNAPPGLMAMKRWLINLRGWTGDVREYVERNRPAWSYPPVTADRVRLLLEGSKAPQQTAAVMTL